MNLRLDILDAIGWFDFQCDRLASQRFDENLHSAAEAEHQVEGRLLLDVVVRQGASVFQLFSGEDQTLLVRRDSWGKMGNLFSLSLLMKKR